MFSEIYPEVLFYFNFLVCLLLFLATNMLVRPWRGPAKKSTYTLVPESTKP